MTDIVERLRAPAYWFSGSSEGHEGENNAPYEAAARIEQLEAALRVSVRYLPYWRPKTELARQIKLDTLAMIRAALEEK